jgi:hypothetical protein
MSVELFQTSLPSPLLAGSYNTSSLIARAKSCRLLSREFAAVFVLILPYVDGPNV